MARPLKEGMSYFSHDTDASNDEKIEAIRALHGNDGYAFYFILCERIYSTPDAELDLSKKAIEAALIKKVGVTPEKFKEMLQTSFELELFFQHDYENRHVITSNGIKKRALEVQSLRDKWRKQKENRVENRVEMPIETPQRKEKKRKEKHDHNNDARAQVIKVRQNIPINEDGHAGDVFVQVPGGPNVYRQYQESIKDQLKPKQNERGSTEFDPLG